MIDNLIKRESFSFISSKFAKTLHDFKLEEYANQD